MVKNRLHPLKFIIGWTSLFLGVFCVPFPVNLGKTIEIDKTINLNNFRVDNDKSSSLFSPHQLFIPKNGKTKLESNPKDSVTLKNVTWINRKISPSDLGVLNELYGLESLAFIRTSGVIILSRNFFENMGELKELVVHHNHRVLLEEGSLGNLKKLQMLSADNQTLTSITSYTFKNCKNLQYLSLSNGFLGEIQSRAFEHLKNLVTINLIKMSLKYLNEKTFNGLPLLNTIDLSGNELYQISGGEFNNLPKLWTLNLERNNLHSLNAEMITQNLPHLIIFAISENKFSCVEKVKVNSILLSNNISSFNEKDLSRCRYSPGRIQIFSS